MADWVTISSLATAAGTLALAGATFSAVRSSNRSARIAELALQEQRRPVLINGRLDDPVQKIMFADGHWIHAQGSEAVVEEEDGTLVLRLHVAEADIGKVIGRQGRLVRALRTIVRAGGVDERPGLGHARS